MGPIRRDILQSLAGLTIAALGGEARQASAQPSGSAGGYGDKSEVVRGIRVAARTKITVGNVPIEIVADETAAKALSEGGKKRTNVRLEIMANRFVEMHRLLGLQVKGLKRIIVSEQKPTDSQPLFQPNDPVWDKESIVPPKDLDLLMCGECEACNCCYCIPIRVKG